ncbi:ABC transporter permease [Alicyclobacillus curvatus]|nr:ABC transporter permease [Alicyclobacillus curvatus]
MIRVAFALALVQWRQLIRDRRAFMMLIAFPVVLTSILSFALGGLFSGTSHPVVKLAIVNEDSGPAGAKLAQFLQGQSQYVNTVKAVTEGDAAAEVRDAHADVGLVIPPSYSRDMANGEKVALKLLATNSNSFQVSLISQLVSGYGLYAADIQFEKQHVVSSGTGKGALQASSAGIGNGSAVKFDETVSGLKPVSAGSYYAIGMMVMFLLSNAINRAHSMVEERQGDRYRRLLASPVGHFTLAMGQWLAMFFILTFQGIILLLCSRFILQIHLGPVGQTGLILVGYAASIAGIATALGSWVSSAQVVSGLAGVGSNIAAVLGGSIFPLYGFPQAMQYIGHALPNGQALTQLVDTVMGISTSELWLPFCYLVLLGLLLGAFGALRFGVPQRKGV